MELYGNYSNMTIVTPSVWLSGLVKESFLKNLQVEIINNGIDLNVFKPTFGKYFDKFNIANKKIILGVSSTWVPSKGIYDFYKIANQLGSDYQVVLVGLTQEQIKQLPDNILGIARTDSVQELAEIYTAASVLLIQHMKIIIQQQILKLWRAVHQLLLTKRVVASKLF